MNESSRWLLICVSIFFTLGISAVIFLNWFITNPDYLDASKEEKLKFELSRQNFEKHREKYEKIKNCFIEEKINIFEKCKSLDYTGYINELKLSSVSSYLNSESGNNNLEIRFIKIKPKGRYTDGYIYSNEGFNFAKYKINIDNKGNKYFINKENYNGFDYKYTIIDKNWVIYEFIGINKQ